MKMRLDVPATKAILGSRKAWFLQKIYVAEKFCAIFAHYQFWYSVQFNNAYEGSKLSLWLDFEWGLFWIIFFRDLHYTDDSHGQYEQA